MQFEDIMVVGYGNFLVCVWFDDSFFWLIYGCEFYVIFIDLLNCFEEKKLLYRVMVFCFIW